MKKTLFFMMILAVLAGGCKKKDNKSTALDYKDKNPIHMVFKDTHKIDVESDYDITYEILNIDPDKKVLSWDTEGVLFGFNVGNDKVKISNGHETKTVNVKVNLFREPSYDFGCHKSKIKEIYGNPYVSQYIDTILVYRYANKTAQGWYSAACFVMDFFFYDNKYFESDVYIRKDYYNPLLMNYLTENFDYIGTIPNYAYDSIITHDSVPADFYQHKIHPEVICGKMEHANQFDDICLFYTEQEEEKSFESSLKSRPRSSKFLY